MRQNKPAGEIVRADRKEPLVVIPLRLATEVAAVAEQEAKRFAREEQDKLDSQ